MKKQHSPTPVIFKHNAVFKVKSLLDLTKKLFASLQNRNINNNEKDSSSSGNNITDNNGINEEEVRLKIERMNATMRNSVCNVIPQIKEDNDISESQDNEILPLSNVDNSIISLIPQPTIELKLQNISNTEDDINIINECKSVR